MLEAIQPALDAIRSVAQVVYYLVATVGVVIAVRTYQKNQSLERSRWLSSLYDKFYERADLKGVRRALDCEPGNTDVAEIVAGERGDFTDYLNFFEHVAYLVECGQIEKADANAYFGYYVECLKQHPAIVQYVSTKSKSYEALATFLRS